jgi:hypothetical protein
VWVDGESVDGSKHVVTTTEKHTYVQARPASVYRKRADGVIVWIQVYQLIITENRPGCTTRSFVQVTQVTSAHDTE